MRADGREFPVELTVTRVPLEGPPTFTAYLRDITERRRAEQALQESERRYRAVVEDQAELIARYDAGFRLIFCNRAYARMFGAEPEALVGQDLFHAVPTELHDSLRANLLGDTPADTAEIGDALDEWASAPPFQVEATVQIGEVVTLTSCG